MTLREQIHERGFVTGFSRGIAIQDIILQRGDGRRVGNAYTNEFRHKVPGARRDASECFSGHERRSAGLAPSFPPLLVDQPQEQGLRMRQCFARHLDRLTHRHFQRVELRTRYQHRIWPMI